MLINSSPKYKNTSLVETKLLYRKNLNNCYFKKILFEVTKVKNYQLFIKQVWKQIINFRFKDIFAFSNVIFQSESN